MKRLVYAAYMRVSSLGQRERHTIEQQREKLEKYAAANNIEISYWYIDDGVSSTKVMFDKRPAGWRVIADARAGKFTVLLICDWDRLARAMHDYMGTLHFLEADLRIKVKSVTQPHENTAEGHLQRNIAGAFAEYEAMRIRERTMGGSRKHAVTPSRYLGGHRPFGFKIANTKQEARIELHQTEGPIMYQIYERISKGQTGSTVGRWLELSKIKTTTGGMIWRASRIQAMIHNPIYKGVLIHGRHTDEPIIRSVPRIVSDELWNSAQEAMRRNRTLAKRNSKYPYLLRSLLRCKQCGRRYIGVQGFEPSYRCLGRAHAQQLLGADAVHLRCTSPSLNLRAAEDLVSKAVQDKLENPLETLEELRESIVARAAVDPKQMAKLEAQLERKLQAKTNFAMQAAEDNMDQETRRRGSQNFDNEIAMLRSQLTELKMAHETAAKQLDQLPSTKAMLKQLRRILSQPLTFATRRELLEKLVDRVDVETITDSDGRTSVKLQVHLRFIVNPSPTGRKWTAGC